MNRKIKRKLLVKELKLKIRIIRQQKHLKKMVAAEIMNIGVLKLLSLFFCVSVL